MQYFIRGIKDIIYRTPKNAIKYILRYFVLIFWLKRIKKKMIGDYIFGINMYFDFRYDGPNFMYYLPYVDYPYKLLAYKMLGKDDVMIDIGSNMGAFALIGNIKNASVHTFEPNMETVDMYNININLNRAKYNIDTNKIHQNKSIVSDVDGKVEFYQFDETKTGVSSINQPTGGNYKKIVLDSVTLDSYISDKNIDKIKYLKIDAEGAEPKIFAGAKDALKNIKIDVIFWESNAQSDSDELAQTIKSLQNYGYTNLYYDYPNKKLKPWNGEHDCLSVSPEALAQVEKILSQID